IPVDQDFTNSGQGRPKDVLALFQRSVARAGLSPAAGHAPEWRAVVLDFEVRNCFLVRAAVADAAEDQTMALKLPDNGRVSTTGVVPAGDGWSVVVTNDDEFSSVVTIPASFQSVRVGGSLGCEDGGTDGMVVSDGGPIEAHPPRLPVLPPTDASFEPASPVSPAPAPGDAPLLFAALGALAAALWWRRRSDAQSGSAARSG
ncbi:MAG: hypothetical protein QOH61_2436, partial [Chloroflexota bacterium]|nr:hypothetical protein [Chloroflexota bacterium]